jgi:Holliday junction resolvase RusA-like endonuclease
MAKKISFRVPGAAQSRGSKRGFAFRRANGKLGVAMADSNKKSGEWMDRVSTFAHNAYDSLELIDGPVTLNVLCVFHRPLAHYSGKKNPKVVKASAPAHKISAPDCSKLLRGIEDALTGVIYKDDRQIVSTQCAKCWGDSDYVEITIEEI